MTEGKSRKDLMLEEQLKNLLAEERAAKNKASTKQTDFKAFDIKAEDIRKGIILKEILGTPKGLEG
ncbi:MAG: hypothetical protein JXN10_03160 [Clostridia bacterium]|nr:hypothetical protein [Clostridia bacterium]MBN2882500.1 hypothetical protein [Clostridia bacterium]